jgi:hypothetical protein
VLPFDTTTCLGRIESNYPTSTIFGKLKYQVGYDVEDANVEIVVPVGIDETDIYCAFEDLCQRYVLLQGGHSGCICFRRDGSKKRMSLRELLQNLRYNHTGRGVPVVRKHKFFQPQKQC